MKMYMKLEFLCLCLWVLVCIAQSALYQSVRYSSESSWPRRTSNKYFFPSYEVRHSTEESATRNVYSRSERRKKPYRLQKKPLLQEEGFRFPDFFDAEDKEGSIFNSINSIGGSSGDLEKHYSGPGIKSFKNYKLLKVPEADRRSLYSNGLIYLLDFHDPKPFYT